MKYKLFGYKAKLSKELNYDISQQDILTTQQFTDYFGHIYNDYSGVKITKTYNNSYGTKEELTQLTKIEYDTSDNYTQTITEVNIKDISYLVKDDEEDGILERYHTISKETVATVYDLQSDAKFAKRYIQTIKWSDYDGEEDIDENELEETITYEIANGGTVSKYNIPFLYAQDEQNYDEEEFLSRSTGGEFYNIYQDEEEETLKDDVSVIEDSVSYADYFGYDEEEEDIDYDDDVEEDLSGEAEENVDYEVSGPESLTVAQELANSAEIYYEDINGIICIDISEAGVLGFKKDDNGKYDISSYIEEGTLSSPSNYNETNLKNLISSHYIEDGFKYKLSNSSLYALKDSFRVSCEKGFQTRIIEKISSGNKSNIHSIEIYELDAGDTISVAGNVVDEIISQSRNNYLSKLIEDKLRELS